MSCRPDLEVESKKDFLAHINLGFKPEYEFKNGSECHEFIKREFGDTENKMPGDDDPAASEISLGESSIEIIDVSDLDSDIGENKSCVVNKVHFEESDENKVKKEEEELNEVVLKNIINGSNLNNIEVIFENENVVKSELDEEINGENFKCLICQKGFASKFEKRRHIQSHIKKQQRPTTCPFCGQTFGNKNELSVHFTCHLTKKISQKSSKQCQICLKIFTRSSNLTRHLDTVHAQVALFECTECLKTFSRRSHLARHTNSCSKSFQKRYLLERSCSGIKNIKCKLCSEEFTASRQLQAHLALFHRDESMFKCEMCPKVFGSKSNLQRHKKTHYATKDFRCQTCQKGFWTKYHLERHLMVHTGEKKFECLVCLWKFTTKYHLKCHLRTHTAPKRYDCPLCYKVFYSVNNFHRHRREHVGFEDLISAKNYQRIDVKLEGDDEYCL